MPPRRKTTQQFCEQANAVHNNFYDYSLTEYVGCNSKVTIICPTHGEFEQRACNHLSGRGCRKCGLYLNSNLKTSSQFIEDAIKKHGNTYEYSNVDYSGCLQPVTITCRIHGNFKQVANDHLCGHGCPKCCNSKGEEATRQVLINLGLEFEEQKKFATCVDSRRLIFDFYIPEAKVLIEYDGQQHYDPNSKWYSEDVVRRDHIKTEWAKENGFKLYRFRDIDSIEALTALLGLSRLRHEPV